MFSKLLSAGGVDVWTGRLSADDVQLAYFASLLSAEERGKAARFINAALANLYIEAHGRLRCILADYCKTAPERLQFAVSAHGKPFLPDYPAVPFNISHSQDRLAVAVARRETCQVGIDVEVWQTRINMAALVKRCFAASEQNYWHALPVEQRQQAFYSIWTQKEAFVKAVGRGIAVGIERCIVATGGAPALLSVPDGYGDAAAWRVALLEELGEGVSGALVVSAATS